MLRFESRAGAAEAASPVSLRLSPLLHSLLRSAAHGVEHRLCHVRLAAHGLMAHRQRRQFGNLLRLGNPRARAERRQQAKSSNPSHAPLPAIAPSTDAPNLYGLAVETITPAAHRRLLLVCAQHRRGHGGVGVHQVAILPPRARDLLAHRLLFGIARPSSAPASPQASRR